MPLVNTLGPHTMPDEIASRTACAPLNDEKPASLTVVKPPIKSSCALFNAFNATSSGGSVSSVKAAFPQNAKWTCISINPGITN